MKRFRIVLPVGQSVLALILGGIGELQRRRILSHPFFFGDGWQTSLRFHVWPWPLKFAVITNLPMMLPSMFLLMPISAEWENVSATVALVLALLSGPVLWYWVGSRFDRHWTLEDRKPWIALLIFNLIALTGSLLNLGYVGYIPFGFALWILWPMEVCRMSWRVSKPVIVRQETGAGE